MTLGIPLGITFLTFYEKRKTHESVCFPIENVVLRMQKVIKNQAKSDAKSMLKKDTQQVWRRMTKGNQNATRMVPKPIQNDPRTSK